MMLNKIKKLVAAAVLAVVPFGSAKADETPITIGAREVVQTGKDLNYQAFGSYGKNKVFVSDDGASKNYGLNLDYANARLNFGFKDTDEDSSRVSLAYNFGKGFAGAEYQMLSGFGREHRLGFFGGVKPCERIDLEATVDTEKSFRSVAFVQPFDKALVSVGGGTDKNKSWSGNVCYSQKLTDRIGTRNYVRVGNNDFLDARVQLGTKLGAQSAKAFGVIDNCFNSLSVVGDITEPLSMNGFDLAGVDSFVGSETFDFGFGARFVRGKRAEVNLALNVGDYGILQNVVLSPEVHRNLAVKVNGARIGASTELGKTGLKLWYQGTFDERKDPEHAVLVGFEGRF